MMVSQGTRSKEEGSGKGTTMLRKMIGLKKISPTM